VRTPPDIDRDDQGEFADEPLRRDTSAAAADQELRTERGAAGPHVDALERPTRPEPQPRPHGPLAA
jgi:hypothetical protein